MNQASPATFNLLPKSEERVRHIFESQEHTEFWYAQLVGSRHEDEAGKIEAEVDAVLHAVGIPPTDWVDYLTVRSGETYPYPEESIEDRQARLKKDPRPLGRYLVECLYNELPIEDGGRDGNSEVVVHLTANGKTIDFSGYGQFWADYIYPNVAGDDSRTAEELEYSDDEEIESEVEYELIIRLTA
jgi:hypothetical protein